MIDIERQITDFFHEEAVGVTPSPGMYDRVASRARTRRAVTTVLAAVSIVAIFAAGVATAVSLHRPAAVGVSGPKNTPAVPLSRGEIARIPVGNEPQPIAADNSGAWVVTGASETNNVLWHIDARTQKAVELPQTRGAGWPAVGEGFAWVTCHGINNPCGRGSLLKLDPKTGATLATIQYPGGTYGPIAVGFGSVWISSTTGRLVEIDVASAKVVATFPIDTNYLAVAGGWLWAVNGDNGLIKIDPSNGRIVDRIPFSNGCDVVPTTYTVWVSTCGGPGSYRNDLIRIDPASGRVLYRMPIRGSGPVMGAFTNGRLWLARWAHEHVEIQARDPATGKPTGVVLRVNPGPDPYTYFGVGPPVIFTAAGADSLWLTHVDQAHVVRVGLSRDGT